MKMLFVYSIKIFETRCFLQEKKVLEKTPYLTHFRATHHNFCCLFQATTKNYLPVIATVRYML